MALRMEKLQPRWHGERKPGSKINTIVIHYVSGCDSHIKHEKDNKYDPLVIMGILNRYKGSYHYLLGRDGTVYANIPHQRRAYHAGESILHGDLDLNHCSLGLSLIGERAVAFTKEQIDSLVELVVELRKQYAIPLNRIVGHDQVAWNRKHPKVDPGPLFPWLSFLDRVGAWQKG